MLCTVCEASWRGNDAMRRVMFTAAFMDRHSPRDVRNASVRRWFHGTVGLCLGMNTGTGRLCRVLSYEVTGRSVVRSI